MSWPDLMKFVSWLGRGEGEKGGEGGRDLEKKTTMLCV